MTEKKVKPIDFSQNIFVFWFASLPQYIWQIASCESVRLLQVFSIPLLLKTFFEPWKRDYLASDGLSLKDKLSIFAENMVARLVGMMIRAIAIFTGLIFSAGFFVAGIIILVFLFLLPVLIFFSYVLYKKGYGI